MSSSSSGGADTDDPLAVGGGDAADLLEVGRIEKAHGLKGEVVISLVTNMVADRTAPGVVLRAGDRDLVVVSSRPHGNRWLVHFEGVGDRNDADALRATILRAAPLETVGEDPGPPSALADHGQEVVAFVHELIGRRVVDQHGVDHGPVHSVIENPASDLLELDDGLVPLTFYRGSDPEAGTIAVDVPDGLLGEADRAGEAGEADRADEADEG